MCVFCVPNVAAVRSFVNSSGATWTYYLPTQTFSQNVNGGWSLSDVPALNTWLGYCLMLWYAGQSSSRIPTVTFVDGSSVYTHGNLSRATSTYAGAYEFGVCSLSSKRVRVKFAIDIQVHGGVLILYKTLL